MEDEATQPSTQQMLDPRRLGRNNSGLTDDDLADVIVLLHPCSGPALQIVADTAVDRPQHVLGQEAFTYHADDSDLDEQETIILNGDKKESSADAIALRMSSETVAPYSGFRFGRNATQADIVIKADIGKRVSNCHFRIYVTENGILMIEDSSTNGTCVDDVPLGGKGKDKALAKTRMLVNGSIILILTTNSHAMIKFLVRIPVRDSHHDEEYRENFRRYVERCAITAQKSPAGFCLPGTNTYGMHWNGGGEYNVIGQLGKGAFATVYKVATVREGQPYAAKELEKRRFVKNGLLDQKIANEMEIMKGLHHPNIVEYKAYREVNNHLYIIMEYVAFSDLSAYLASKQRLAEPLAKRVGGQILSALAYLHKRKITHRDIKPDNILIASLDPFNVKLSDFGLSKVVNHDDTFLKTFCGTLLYCAPEVFPFDPPKGTKRRRGSSQKFHSYSSAVDIWSFAGVLWYALCGQPPFAGIADNGGRAMFERIMTTPLDPTPLREFDVSEECIDLLIKMLNVDPSRRPTEQQCLHHPWLNDGSYVLDEAALDDIEEEDEEDEEEEEEEEEETGQQLSQLSINDEDAGADEAEEDDGIDITRSEYEVLYQQVQHQSKRIKTDPRMPRNQMRDREETESSVDESFHGIYDHGVPTSGRPRLFGEIGESALEDSRVLGVQADVALSIHDSDGSSDSRHAPPANAVAEDPIPSSSLLGAESMVRELNMASPSSPNSVTQSDNEPSTPKTPENLPHSSLSLSSGANEITPKALPFSRQIVLPKSASFYYNPYDPSTHNLEYASKVSGHDYVTEAEAQVGQSEELAVPDTIRFSTQAMEENGSGTENDCTVSAPAFISTSLNEPASFVKPPPRLGKLTTTPESFTSLVLKIEQHQTSWGRLKECTIVYPDTFDTRVSKKAFTIFWHSESAKVEELDNEGKDWTKLPDLYAGIFTCAKAGIRINGVPLKQNNDKGVALFGRLHTGDVIQVFNDPRDRSILRFKCEFYHGEGKAPRAPSQEAFKIEKSPVKLV